MSDNLVLDLLRAIGSDIGEMKADVIEIKERLGLLRAQYASLSLRIDRIGYAIEHIEATA